MEMNKEELSKHINVKEMENMSVEEYVKWKHPLSNLRTRIPYGNTGVWRVWVE